MQEKSGNKRLGSICDVNYGVSYLFIDFLYLKRKSILALSILSYFHKKRNNLTANQVHISSFDCVNPFFHLRQIHHRNARIF